MRKTTKSINEFKGLALNKQSQNSIKGGHKHKNKQKDWGKEIEKIQKKLAKAAKKNDMKKMAKYQNEIDCIGITYSVSCCGNGLGTW